MTKPIHTHDCDNCAHVATTTFEEGGAVDVYVCKHETFVEYVYRYSSEGPDYVARMAENPQPDLLYLKELATDPH